MIDSRSPESLRHSAGNPAFVRLCDAHGAMWFDAEAMRSILGEACSLTQAQSPACTSRARALLEGIAEQRFETVTQRGGRGAVRFFDSALGSLVLRSYRRGGLIGRWVRRHYLWLGESRTRCYREFHLLQQLAAQGLPVPHVVAAGFVRNGLGYRAELLMRAIPDSRPLAQHLAALDAESTRAIAVELGRLLARFHRQGVYHADLNAFNVMVDAQGKLWLIDFDRGELRPPDAQWQRANLQRLRRSLWKTAPQWAGASGVDVETLFATLVSAYQASMRLP
ncbi:MAG: 3-deoxy-D-manno-octulosonic acid kinase [Alphaproteobacteria bacterium ADurb.BinA280]|nr:MAG: 3-deoxy-D-manno-octulosonic acid kinase [Alphaproteobacteria bacterium ADurb.BinA280]